MSRLQKIRRVLSQLLMMFVAIILLITPEVDDVIFLIAVGLGLVLLAWGLQKLVYYLRMGRHMVGGFSLLFIGVIAMDAGLLALRLSSESVVLVMLYLVGGRVFTGAIALARAFEARSYNSPWKLKLFHGVVELAAAVACVICVVALHSPRLLVVIYSASLIYSGIISIIDTLRPQDIVYIQ